MMEGKQCRQLLQKSLELVQKLPQKYHLFALILNRFDAVVTSCFEMNIQEYYVQMIADFKVSYGNLGISVTPKVKAVVVHVPE